MVLTLATREAIRKTQAVRYRLGARVVKSEILDAMCAVTGWHGDYARRSTTRALLPRWKVPLLAPLRSVPDHPIRVPRRSCRTRGHIWNHRSDAPLRTATPGFTVRPNLEIRTNRSPSNPTISGFVAGVPGLRFGRVRLVNSRTFAVSAISVGSRSIEDAP